MRQVQAATLSIDNLVLGKVIQVGSKRFVKIRQDTGKGAQFLALAPFSYQQIFNYTGTVQTWTVPYSGTYQIELWGAQGGTNSSVGAVGGYGGYVKGEIYLPQATVLYFVVGGTTASTVGGYNGGGNPYNYSAGFSGGGGATDVRLVTGAWNDAASLNSRLMVAGAASSANAGHKIGHAGGLIGYIGSYLNSNTQWYSNGGNQVGGGTVINTTCGSGIPGSFGQGGNGSPTLSAGGGGGYYGGGGGTHWCVGGSSGGGGSSFISGHTGCVAITSATDQTPKSGCTTGTTDNNCSVHYSGKVFTDTVMIDGAGYAWTNVKGGQVAMPNLVGGSYSLGTGHTGNGVARVTLI